MIEDQINDGWFSFNKRDSFSYIKIIAIASGNLIPGLIYNIIYTLFEPMAEWLRIELVIKTFILLCGSLICFILGPLLGAFSDRLMFKYGRRRIFIIIGTLLALISSLLMMYSYEIGISINYEDPLKYGRIFFFISIILSFIAANIVQFPARALCSDVTPPSQQNLMSNICQACSSISPLISNFFCAFEIYTLTEISQESFMIIISFSIAVLAMLISVIVAKEEPLSIKPEKRNPFKQIWQASKSMPKPFIKVLPAFILANVSIYQYQVVFTDLVASEIFKVQNSASADTFKKKIPKRNYMGSNM